MKAPRRDQDFMGWQTCITAMQSYSLGVIVNSNADMHLSPVVVGILKQLEDI
jgi:hypothetical protein